MRRNFLNSGLLISMCLLASCISTGGKNIEINSEYDADESYFKSYEAHTKQAKVIHNFETRFTVSTTYLSPDFRTSLAKRYEKVFGEAQKLLEESSNKTSFFVVLYAYKKEKLDLANNKLWFLRLETAAGKFQPSAIKKLNEKPRWIPFFGSVNTWTEEYLVVFDQPELVQSAQLVDKASMQLFMSNADAKLNFSW